MRSLSVWCQNGPHRSAMAAKQRSVIACSSYRKLPGSYAPFQIRFCPLTGIAGETKYMVRLCNDVGRRERTTDRIAVRNRWSETLRRDFHAHPLGRADQRRPQFIQPRAGQMGRSIRNRQRSPGQPIAIFHDRRDAA